MNNRFAVIMVALVIVFGGILVVSKKKADAPTANGSSSSGQVTNHVEGEGKKGVTLVEYGDYECPACTQYYPLLKQVYEKYKQDIKFQFANFPLVQIHQHAMQAHRAAEAADKQGKYWEMHDLLYENHDTWTAQTNVTPIFEAYASQLGLDVAKFKKDAASSAVNDAINADMKKGTSLKVTSTPTFFIDGKKIDQNPQDLEGFSKLIDNAIAAKAKNP